jgi:flavin-dependent dehydrogenase
MTVLVAGGGRAGAAAACLLGDRATLIERETGPHDKICGEFISWEAQDALARLGIDLAALGAVPIDAVRLIHGAALSRATLPRPGASLSRRVLDEALLLQAANSGARIMRGHAVRRLMPDGLDVDGLGHLGARRILLATGKHDLRGARRRGQPEDLVGLKMHYRLAPAQAAALAGHVEVVLFPGGYAGLQPVEDGLANLCLLIQRPVFDAAGADWPGVVGHLNRTAPWLAARLDGAQQRLDRPVAIFRVPYGFVHRAAPEDQPNVLRLGDQMGVIPSFSGDGMAIALHTAFAAVATLDDPAAYHARLRRDLHGQIGRAMLLHRLGQAQPRLLTLAARAWPGALALVARLTRVPSASLAWR